MTRGVVLFLVGSGLLITLAACGRWFEERAPWRHDAEVTCLRSGAVKEGPGIEALRPIDGPGSCGADFPLRVSALGSAAALSFADELEPPGLIPSRTVRPPMVMSQPGAGSAPLPSGQSVSAPAALSQPGPPVRLGTPTAPVAPPGPAVVSPPATLIIPIVIVAPPIAFALSIPSIALPPLAITLPATIPSGPIPTPHPLSGHPVIVVANPRVVARLPVAIVVEGRGDDWRRSYVHWGRHNHRRRSTEVKREMRLRMGARGGNHAHHR